MDEFHLLLKEEQTAAYSVEIWKRFRKWGGIPTGITQNVKDLLSSREVENIFENSDFIIMLNQAAGDRQILASQLNISPHQLSYVTQSGEGIARRRFRRTSVWWAAARAAWTPLPGCLSVSISRSSPPPPASSPLFSTSTGMCSPGESFVRSVKAEDEEAGRGGEAARRKFLSGSGLKQKNGLLENTSKPSLFSVKPERGIR